MIRNHQFKTSSFAICCSPQHSPQQNYTHTNKKTTNKISLRTPNDKITKRFLSPPSNHKHQYTFSQNCPTISDTLTSPKPKITFCWKNDLDETTRKLGMVSNQLQLSQLQLRETKSKKLHTKQLIESKFTAEQRLSRGSINLPQDTPKLEESFILIDYFHPTSNQLNSMLITEE